MKRFFPGLRSIAIVMAILCFFATLFPSTAAYAQGVSPQTTTHAVTAAARPHVTTRPKVSGGGCNSTYSGNKTRYVEYSSCSTYFFLKIFADSFVTFGAASPSLWRACSVNISLWDGNYTFLNSRTFDCLQQARSNEINYDFGYSQPTGFGASYYVEVYVYYNYNPDGKGYYGPIIWSPKQYT